jgi:hypothetical protein
MKMEQIIKSAWPKMCPDLVRDRWLGRINKDGEGFDMFMALTLTMVTKLEDLDIQAAKHSSTTLTQTLLHYHRTVQEAASGGPFLFLKLKEILTWGVRLPGDPGRLMISWVPLPIAAEKYWICDTHLEHFEYTVLQEH